MAEKQCPACKKMIDKQAKVCPYCKKIFGMSKPLKYFLVLLFLGLVIYQSQNTPHNSPTNSISTEKQDISLTEKGKKVKEKHRDWSNNVCNTIAEKKIFIGMTAEQVKVAWGKPYRINTTSTQYVEHEQWVMHDSINSDYLDFDNGILTSIQQSKK